MKTPILQSALACLAAAVSSAAPLPFDLPRGAVPDERESAGWDVSGTIALSLAHARAQFASRLASSGWTNLHAIDVSRDRVLEAWTRGRRTLTLMIWRIDTGNCGFSCGLTEEDRKERVE